LRTLAAVVTLNTPDELKPEVADWGMMRLRERLSELDDLQRAALVAYLERGAAESPRSARFFLGRRFLLDGAD